MIRRTVIVVALVVAAASCTWPMAGQGPERRNWSATERAVTPADDGQIRAGWSVPVSAAAEVVGDAQRMFVRSRICSRRSIPSTGARVWHVTAAPAARCPVSSATASWWPSTAPAARCNACCDDRAPQAAATIGFAYGADAATRSRVTAPSVLTENGRVAVSHVVERHLRGAELRWRRSGHQLWGAATTVTSSTPPSTRSGPRPRRRSAAVTRAVDLTGPAPFGEVTRTDAGYAVPQGNDIVAYPQTCTSPCAAAWRPDVRRAGRTSRRAPRRPVAIGAADGPADRPSPANGAVAWTAAGRCRQRAADRHHDLHATTPTSTPMPSPAAARRPARPRGRRRSVAASRCSSPSSPVTSSSSPAARPRASSSTPGAAARPRAPACAGAAPGLGRRAGPRLGDQRAHLRSRRTTSGLRTYEVAPA